MKKDMTIDELLALTSEQLLKRLRIIRTYCRLINKMIEQNPLDENNRIRKIEIEKQMAFRAMVISRINTLLATNQF